MKFINILKLISIFHLNNKFAEKTLIIIKIYNLNILHSFQFNNIEVIFIINYSFLSLLMYC